MGKANLRDIPKDQSQGLKFAGAAASDFNDELNLKAETITKIRQPIRVTPIESTRGLKTKSIEYRGKQIKVARVYGAAGETQVPEQKLKEISDPYSAETRKSFTDLALTDPVIAPAMTFRVGALFENGFDLKLTLASKINPQTGADMTPEEINAQLSSFGDTYNAALIRLITFKDAKKIESLAKDLEAVSLPQGKAAALITPGIMDLKMGELPQMVEIITADDLGNPIIDVGMTRALVACKLELDDKQLARADELVYLTRGIKGLRREGKFHGVSPFEPILTISKAIKRFYHLDAPLAMVAAYIARQLIKIKNTEGDESELSARVTTFMTELYKASNWAIAMPEWFDGVEVIKNEVDWAMFDGIENKLANIELAQLGVPKSSQNRELNLNRDLATIQAIQFVRFIRKPAENEIKEALETQLLNPLFAHLLRQPLSQIPVRVEIMRKNPDGKDIDELYDANTQNKNAELSAGNLMQNQAQSPFGASGAVHVTETKDGFIVTPIGTPASH